MNKGIKADYKQYWDVELGVTYIPWSKVREDQLEELKEGGMLDVDTLSPGKKTKREKKEKMKTLYFELFSLIHFCYLIKRSNYF